MNRLFIIKINCTKPYNVIMNNSIMEVRMNHRNLPTGDPSSGNEMNYEEIQ